MVTQFTPAFRGSYEFNNAPVERNKADKEVQENPKKSEVTQTEAIGDYQLSQRIDKLSSNLQQTLLYTKEASKAVAEMILTKKVEILA